MPKSFKPLETEQKNKDFNPWEYTGTRVKPISKEQEQNNEYERFKTRGYCLWSC